MFAFKVREESHLDEQIFHSLTQVMTVCCIDSWQVISGWSGKENDSLIHPSIQLPNMKHHHSSLSKKPCTIWYGKYYCRSFHRGYKQKSSFSRLVPDPQSEASWTSFSRVYRFIQASPESPFWVKKRPISTVWWEKSGGNHLLGCLNAWRWWEIPCLFSVVFVRFMKQQQYFPMFSGKIGGLFRS